MTNKSQSRFKKTILASLIGTALAPQASWSLDLAQSPPGTVEPYVAPNVIVSVDDSGSMNYCLNKESASNCINKTNANDLTVPNADGSWPLNSRRINVLKYALKQVFEDKDLLPDGKIRLSWQVMHNNGGSPNADNVNTSAMNQNSMRVLDNTHRNNFLTFAGKLSALNGTPTHKMFSQADAYMRGGLSKNSPWASIPGAKAAPYLSCRRNYHIVMTDGRWNSETSATSAGEQDNTPKTLPDGTIYSTSQTNIYRQAYSNTLADWAFKSWSSNLQPSLYDPSLQEKQVQLSSEYRKAPATELIGGVNLQKFWNPKYDPANWPHMVTYTIGFSQMAYTWKQDFDQAKFNITAPSTMIPFGYDGSYPNLINGTKTWPDMDSEDQRALDLWHSAINGRGRFFAVQQGADLERAFRMILQQISTETEPDRGSTAASGSPSLTGGGVDTFGVNYDPKKAWKGWITGQTTTTLKQLDGSFKTTTSAIPGWSGKDTAQRLDDIPAASLDNRLILSWSDKNLFGVPFKWATDESNLSTNQKAFFNLKLDGTSDSNGQNRLKYVRGDRSLEGTDDPLNYTSPKIFRQRQSRQGDIVNSKIWYVSTPVINYPLKGYSDFTDSQKSRSPMFYVGGNDGMLHGFSAKDGNEKLAYVPRGVLPSLGRLSDPSFNDNHKYFVDGSPMTGDIDVGTSTTPQWRTMLVGSLGAGGKGYFSLNVTNPSAFTESNAQNLVTLDRTRHINETSPDCTIIATPAEKNTCEENNDIGHIFVDPVIDESNPLRASQITRLNNNRWAVVMGNGYNNKNERPVLLIQYLDGAKELVRIVATGSALTGAGPNTTENGLSAPRLVDINGDGRSDIVYAGDLKGNMWKFDITSNLPSKWNVAFAGQPFITVKGPASPTTSLIARTIPQPITAPPSARANDRKGSTGASVGGMMVAFGTGQNVTKSDPNSVVVQSIYSVLDNTRYKNVGEFVEICKSTGSGPEPTPSGQCNIDSSFLPSAVSGVGQLAARSINTASPFAGDSTDTAGRTYWKMNTPTAINWGTQKGWYMDLPETGERLLKPMNYFDSSNILAVYSQVPAKGNDASLDPNEESCKLASVDAERQYLTLLNIMDGTKPTIQVLNLATTSTGYGSSRMSLTKGSQTLVVTSPFHATNSGAGGREDLLRRMPEQSMRPSWRQQK